MTEIISWKKKSMLRRIIDIPKEKKKNFKLWNVNHHRSHHLHQDKMEEHLKIILFSDLIKRVISKMLMKFLIKTQNLMNTGIPFSIDQVIIIQFYKQLRVEMNNHQQNQEIKQMIILLNNHNKPMLNLKTKKEVT